jgi:hypothetical protein
VAYIGVHVGLNGSRSSVSANVKSTENQRSDGQFSDPLCKKADCDSAATRHRPPTPTVRPSSPPISGPTVNRCPAGMRATRDGFCLAAGQTYCGSGTACSEGMECIAGGRCSPGNGCFPNQFRTSTGGCAYVGVTVCSGGTTCPASMRCSADGDQCFGSAR